MATSNKKSPSSHDASTDSDDTDRETTRADFNPNNHLFSSTKHRGYSNESSITLNSSDFF